LASAETGNQTKVNCNNLESTGLLSWYRMKKNTELVVVENRK